ncbi:MAG: hypothetical protein ACLPY1_03850 [Terracidiphilus sp.]
MLAQKLMITALLPFLIQGSPWQQEQRSVLLPAHESKAVSDRYSRERSEKIGGSWQPTKVDLDGLESNLPQISSMKVLGWDSKIHIDHPDRYFRQYVAVLVAGRREVFVNAFCDGQSFPDWRERLVVVIDGGTCYWQALYDPATKQFSNLMINARA